LVDESRSDCALTRGSAGGVFGRLRPRPNSQLPDERDPAGEPITAEFVASDLLDIVEGFPSTPAVELIDIEIHLTGLPSDETDAEDD
jgi:hypothetical protein